MTPAGAAGQPVRATGPGEYNALAFQGIKVWTCHKQIRDMLEQRFGDSYILCFARPVENAATGGIDWYSPVRGAARPLAELPEDDREKAVAYLRGMAMEIEKVADELIRTNEPLKVTRGNILQRALLYPDPSCIYVIAEQPIITAWGFSPGTPGVEALSLTRISPPPEPAKAAAPEKAAIPAAPAQSSLPGCLWLLLPLCALLLLLFLLFTSFGPVPAVGGKEFFHLDGKPFMEDLAARDLSALKATLARLELETERHIAECRPQKEPERPAQLAPIEEPKKSNALEIPENAENLEFLAGRWLCETGLASTRTGEPVQVFFSFDDKGNGQATIIESSDQCDGLAHARLEGKALHIEMRELQCRRQNTAYGKASINCENSASNQTLCVGRNYDGTTWGATFLKLR